MVACDGQVIGENVGYPGITISLPRTASYLVYPPPQNAGWQIVLILAGDLAGFTAGTGGGVKSEGVSHQFLTG